MRLIYIVGVGRSGTSLLHSIIGSHSEIKSIPENKIFRYLSSLKSDLINHEDIYNLLLENTNLLRLQITKKVVTEMIDKSSNHFVIYSNILNYLSEINKKYLCEKDPKSLDLIENLIKFDNQIKIIHIIRDPRSVVASRLKVKWTKFKSVIFHSLVYNSQLVNYDKKFNKIKTNIIEIKYEELVSSPEININSICNFLELNFEKSMLDFTSTSEKIVANEELSWKKETFGSIKDFSQKWKDDLTTFQIFLIELFTPIAYKSYGYKRSFRFKFIFPLNFLGSLFSKVVAYFYKIFI